MSSVVIKDCKQNGHGTTINTAISRKIATLLGFAFVDDADLITTASNAHTSGTEMIHNMQALMTHWCGCVRDTGGSITPIKTRWFLISFFWTNAHTSGTEMIHNMQVLETHWCGCIRATGGSITPVKTRWFLISFFWGRELIGNMRQKILSWVTSRSQMKKATSALSPVKSPQLRSSLLVYL